VNTSEQYYVWERVLTVTRCWRTLINNGNSALAHANLQPGALQAVCRSSRAELLLVRVQGSCCTRTCGVSFCRWVAPADPACGGGQLEITHALLHEKSGPSHGRWMRDVLPLPPRSCRL
jgi:hypothetical protein